MSEEVAVWSVESIALALGIISEKEAREIRKKGKTTKIRTGSPPLKAARPTEHS
jgi:hypothetical protein